MNFGEKSFMVSKLTQEKQMFELVNLAAQLENRKSFVAHQGLALSKISLLEKMFRDLQKPGSGHSSASYRLSRSSFAFTPTGGADWYRDHPQG
jgi:hypothetical protein